MDSRTVERWGCLWRSDSRLDGRTRHLMWEQGQPLLFRTRAEARAFINTKYGYIKYRDDLRAEPHGWKMPEAVKVRVILEVVGHG